MFSAPKPSPPPMAPIYANARLPKSGRKPLLLSVSTRPAGLGQIAQGIRRTLLGGNG